MNEENLRKLRSISSGKQQQAANANEAMEKAYVRVVRRLGDVAADLSQIKNLLREAQRKN